MKDDAPTAEPKLDSLRPALYALRRAFSQEYPAAANLIGCRVRIDHDQTLDAAFPESPLRAKGAGYLGDVGRFSQRDGTLRFEVTFDLPREVAPDGRPRLARYAASELTIESVPLFSFAAAHVRATVYELRVRKERVTWDEFVALRDRISSYERSVLYRNLTSDALCRWVADSTGAPSGEREIVAAVLRERLVAENPAPKQEG